MLLNNNYQLYKKFEIVIYMVNHKQEYHKYKSRYMQTKKIELSVRDPHLYYIQIGKKTIECRKGNANKFKHWIGQKVYFWNSDRKIPVIIEEIRHYDNLYDFIKNEDYKKVMPNMNSEQDTINFIHTIYSDDVINKAGGICAMQIKIV